VAASVRFSDFMCASSWRAAPPLLVGAAIGLWLPTPFLRLGQGCLSALPAVTKLQPVVRVEIVLIDDPIAVEAEEIVLGCADLDQLGHARGVTGP
jgi:hypothetical protein